MIYKKGRRDLLDWLKKQLIGPASGQDVLRGSPLDRYPTGILFPIVRDQEGVDPASVSEDGDDTESLADDTTVGSDAQPAIKRRRYMPPSSVGFSFFVQGEEIRFQVGFSAARYLVGDNYLGRSTTTILGAPGDRHGVTGASPRQQRSSESCWPRVMRGASRDAARSVDRGTHRPAIEPRKS